MQFHDEFEYETMDGFLFLVEVRGHIDEDNNNVLEHVNICNSTGDSIDEMDSHYEEVMEEAQTREYEVEVHTRDFDYCDSDIDAFLKH